MGPELDLRPQLERLDGLIARSEGLDPAALSFAFRPVRQRHEAPMPYTVPAPADLAARFPAFAAVPPTTLAQAIAEAQTRVDTSWLPVDYAIAILLLAAHTLTLDGLGTGAEAAAAAAGTLGYASLRSGGLSLDRARPPRGAAEPSMLAETTYGRRFLALLKVNQPAILVP